DKGNEPRAVERAPARGKGALDKVSFRTHRVEPKAKRPGRAGDVLRIGLDEGRLIMGNAPVARIEDHAGATGELRRQRQGDKPRGKSDRRRVALEADALG